jgi:lipid A 3-O-deacylase
MFKTVVAFWAALCTSAVAADLSVDGGASSKDTADSKSWTGSIVSELRAGWLEHDAGIFSNKKEKGSDGNAELLFTSPDVLSAIWSPRPHLGTSINTAGETSQVYGGLTWTYNFTDRVFSDFSFGPSLNNGALDKRDPERKALGSHILFRESLSAGWRFDGGNSLSIMLDHVSNGGLARYNGGMETIGLRYGYRF